MEGRRGGRASLAIAIIIAASFALFIVIAVQDVTSVGTLVRDPTVTAEVPWYTGFASSLGTIGWAVAATSFGLTAYASRGRSLSSTDERRIRSLQAAALLSTVLLIDDLFLLHDDILLRLLGSELPVYAAYAVSGLLWAWYSRPLILGDALPALVLAVGFLALSVIVDITWSTDRDARLILEDGAKFTGIWLWALFAVIQGEGALRRITDRTLVLDG